MNVAYSTLCRKEEEDLTFNQFDPPPYGPPPGGPPPYGPPPPHGPSLGGPPPGGPPPNFQPQQPIGKVGFFGIQMCLFKNTYMWLSNGRSFWFYPTMVTQNAVSGFRWSKRRGWIPRTIPLNTIRSFQCF